MAVQQAPGLWRTDLQQQDLSPPPGRNRLAPVTDQSRRD